MLLSKHARVKDYESELQVFNHGETEPNFMQKYNKTYNLLVPFLIPQQI